MELSPADSDFTVLDGVMFVATITVPRHLRGCGFGSAELDRLCVLADVNGWVMELTPSDVFGTPLSVLVPWYSRRGFWPVPGSDRMRRPAVEAG